MAGLWHTLELLKQIERRIIQVNGMTIAPRGGIAGRIITPSGTAAQAAQIERLVASTNSLARAEGNLRKVQRSVHGPASNKAGYFEKIETRKTGPGSTFTQKTDRLNRAVKSTETIDYAAAEKELEKSQRLSDRKFDQANRQRTDKAKALAALDAHNATEIAKRKTDSLRSASRAEKEASAFFTTQSAEKEKNLKDSIRIQERNARAGMAADKSVASFENSKSKAGEARQKAIEKSEAEETKSRAKTRAAQQKTFEDLRGQHDQQVRANEFQKNIAGLKAQGFKLDTHRDTIDQKTGRTTRREAYSRVRDGRKETVSATSTRGPAGPGGGPGRYITGNFTTHQGAQNLNPNFLANLAKVTAWTASVAALYGAVGLAKKGLVSMIDTGYQTQRLSQVFQGVGGTTRQLANDVMRLAAAEGRSRDEAMESAIQWSRLGLNRAQVNEAVRVSLIAANVAEISAGEATERLSSIMAAYKLKIGQLGGALGQLNSISNTHNVTVNDLLDGFARAGAIAHQAGVSFSETAGIIGAARGITGQSGSVIGNTIKSMIGSLNNRTKQSFLREKFNIELTTDGGNDIKDASKALADLYVAYQKMTAAERTHMLFETFGKMQAGRAASIMDSYVKGQTLAIAAQMNLNSAEEENLKIKAALKSQLTSLVAEWERFVNLQGARGPAQALTEVTQTLRNVLRISNTPIGGGIATGLMALSAVFTARFALGAVQLSKISNAGGFVANSFRAIGNASRGINSVMNSIVSNFLAVDRSSTLVGRGMTSLVTRIGGATVAARMLSVVAISLYQTLLPLILIVGAMAVFNKVMNVMGSASEKSSRRLAGFNDEAERAANAADAAAKSIRLLGTAQAALKSNRRPEERSKIISDVSSVAYFNEDGTPDGKRNRELNQELQTLEKQGKTGEILLRLETLKSQKFVDRMIQRNREVESQNQTIRLLREEIALLDKREDKKGSLSKEDRDKRDSMKTQLSEAGQKKTQAIIDHSANMEGDRAEFLSEDLQHLTYLEKQRVLTQAISDIYSDLPQFSFTDKLNAEVAELEAIVAQSDRMLHHLNNDPNSLAKMAKEKAEQEKLLQLDYDRAKAQSESTKLPLTSGARKALEDLRALGEAQKEFLESVDASSTGPVNTPLNALAFGPTKSVHKRMLQTPLNQHLDAAPAHVKKAFYRLKKELPNETRTPSELIEIHDLQSGVQNELSEKARAINALRGKPTTESEEYYRNQEAIKSEEQRKKEAQAKLGSVGSQENRDHVSVRDQNVLTSQFVRNDITASSTGADEAERLVSGEQRASELIQKNQAILDLEKRHGEAIVDSTERRRAAVTILEAMNSIQEAGIRKEEMLAKLTADRTNMIKEQRKEFEKSMLMSSTGDLLRKIAVKSMADKPGGVNLGGFMAMSRDARQDYVDSSGIFKRREMDRQMETLRNSGGGMDQHQQLAERARQNQLKQGQGLYENAGGAGGSGGGISSQFSKLTETSSGLNIGFRLLAEAVSNLQIKMNSFKMPAQGGGKETASIWNALDESAFGGSPA